jgi:hypothetical protein
VDIVSPYGFGGFAGHHTNVPLSVHWNRFVRGRKYVCGYIGLHPVLSDLATWNTDELFRARDLYILDLRLTVKELLSNMSGNRRRQLRNWDVTASTLEHDHPAMREFVLDHAARFLTDKGASTARLLSRETLNALVSSAAVFVVGRRGEANKTIAVSTFAHTRYAADYLLNVSSPGGECYATALLWSAILRLKSMEVPILNLGGGGAQDGDGISEFKRRFGALPTPFYSLRQIYDFTTFENLCGLAGVPPRAQGPYFPPYYAAKKTCENA